VLALDAAPQASCAGVAFRVRGGAEDATLAYLRDRELVSAAYLETRQQVRLADGAQVEAVTFVIDRAHGQYCGGLPLEEQAAIIARAAGRTGTNADYLWNTVAHLDALGLSDPDLAWLGERVRLLKGF
jgi:cation transport protein ChaC